MSFLPVRPLLLFSLSLIATPSVRSQTSPPPQAAALTSDQQGARDALSQGVQAFKNAQFDEAVRLFERAKQLDPLLVNASLYLATAYASQYIPGAPSEENQERARLAVSTYKDALAVDSNNLSAIDGLASILYQKAGQPFSEERFKESKAYHQKHIELKPDDPRPYYSIGVIDWVLAYRANSKLREEFNKSVGVGIESNVNSQLEDQSEEKPAKGLLDTDPLPEVLRRDYVQQYGSIVDEGMAYLKRAIELKPDYDDAMTYLNLLYRRKADTVANGTEREELTRLADELLDHVKNMKQKRAAQAPTNDNQ